MSEREKGEREKGSEKQQPSHRVSFARFNGQDREGRDILGPTRQIGSIWERKGKDGEGILRFDHIPEELRRDGGVVFVSKVAEREGGDAPAKDGGGNDTAGKEPRARARDDERDR